MIAKIDAHLGSAMVIWKIEKWEFDENSGPVSAAKMLSLYSYDTQLRAKLP